MEFALASSLRLLRRDDEADAVLRRLIDEHPAFDPAPQALFESLLGRGRASEAVSVLQAWMARDPRGVGVRLLQARVFMLAQRNDAAESMLLALLADRPDEIMAWELLGALYQNTGDKDGLEKRLREALAKRPDDLTAVRRLAQLLAEGGRAGDAVAVVDAARRAVRHAEQVYMLSHLYEPAGRKDLTEATLREALKIDPRHAGAANDLGYMMADDGRNLAESERLIRMAVEAEPDNHAFLDSLGWVLYKQGRFAEAAEQLGRAVESSLRPDPVVLDHYGDALYRLGRVQEAAERWRAASERAERGTPLLRAVEEKLRRHRAGEKVETAPLAAEQERGIETPAG